MYKQTEPIATQPNDFKHITSSRGGKKLNEGGLLFGKQRIWGDVTHWQCERKGACKARLHTQGMLIVKRTNEHLHGPDIAAVSCVETKSGIKRKAHQTQDSTHHIIGENLALVTQSAAIKLPKIDSLKRTIRSQRQIVNHACPQPLTLADLVLPTEYQQTNKGDQFILYDSGQDNSNRFMIFGTHENFEMLKILKFG